MYFANVAELLAMGGHGFYVWLAYGISLCTLVALTVYPLRRQKQALQAIRQRKLHENENEKGDSHGHASQA